MNKPKEFTITSYDWRREISEKLQRAGHSAPDDCAILAALTALGQFLENHNLVTRQILKNGSLAAGKDFALRSSDLTEVGRAVIREGFGKWERLGCPAGNLKPLERALAKVDEAQ